MKIILYTTHCPRCEILKKMLKDKDIEFLEEIDIDIMSKKGFMTVPMLEVDGEVMNYTKAFEWVNNN